MNTVLEDIRRASENAYQQIVEAKAIVRSVTRSTAPSAVAWALGVTHAQHPQMALPLLTAGQVHHWGRADCGSFEWPMDERKPRCAFRYVYDQTATVFWAHDATTFLPAPMLRVPHKAVADLLRAAPIPAAMLAELREAARLTGLGRDDAERAAIDRRVHETGAAVWELARPDSAGRQLDLMDLIGVES